MTTRGPLADRFGVPPFSILNGREGWWQNRKRRWIACGIKSEIGRDAESYQSQDKLNAFMAQKGAVEELELSGNETGTSIFDPVLTELCYTWLCPAGGQIVDPFAGGSVRGVVAAALGRKYWGCDLSERQIEANKIQAKEILKGDFPTWVAGDSLVTIASAPLADLVFTCPPYGDLEVYSNDERDLSTMDYYTFMLVFKRILERTAARLKDNRFMVLVVGDYRDLKTGMYRGFVADTITGMRDCGLGLYNDVILATPIGSLPIRAGRYFETSRKLGCAHQRVLIFLKGDYEKAVAVLDEPALTSFDSLICPKLIHPALQKNRTKFALLFGPK